MCDKYCGTGQYLDYDNCVCRKKLIDFLIEECASIVNIDLIEKKKKESSAVNIYLYFIYYIFSFMCFVNCRINILLS